MNLIGNWELEIGNSGRDLHHAYCIEGEKDAVYKMLCVFFEDELEIKTRGNPDFSYLDFDTFTIDEGRILKDRQQKKSLSGGKKIFVISTNSITREAQNSLLKIFEEPTEGTHFFLILSSSRILIPTLKSRLHVISSISSKGENEDENEKEKDFKKEIKKFVEFSKSERLLYLKSIIENKDKQKAFEFVDGLESYLVNRADFGKIKKDKVYIFDEIIKAKQYLGDKGSSIKMILEHLALILD